MCRCPEDALGLGRLEPEVVRSVADFVQMLEGEFLTLSMRHPNQLSQSSVSMR